MFKTFKKLTAAVVLLTSATISQAETEISYSANIGLCPIICIGAFINPVVLLWVV